MAVKLCVIVKMEIVMNKLTIDKLEKIWDGKNNFTDKPIFITFKADW